VFISHLEPQLKRCHSEPQPRNAMCLTPISSHNSRDTFRATTQGIRSESQLKEHSSKLTFEVSPKPCRSHTSKQTNHKSCLCIIAWRCSRAVKRYTLPDRLAGASCCQAPNAFDATVLQVSPGGMTLNARRYASQKSPRTVAIAWRSKLHRQALH